MQWGGLWSSCPLHLNNLPLKQATLGGGRPCRGLHFCTPVLGVDGSRTLARGVAPVAVARPPVAAGWRWPQLHPQSRPAGNVWVQTGSPRACRGEGALQGQAHLQDLIPAFKTSLPLFSLDVCHHNGWRMSEESHRQLGAHWGGGLELKIAPAGCLILCPSPTTAHSRVRPSCRQETRLGPQGMTPESAAGFGLSPLRIPAHQLMHTRLLHRFTDHQSPTVDP